MITTDGHLAMVTINRETGEADTVTYRVTGYTPSCDDQGDDILHVVDQHGDAYEIIRRPATRAEQDSRAQAGTTSVVDHQKSIT
ncbi:hypothetical protein [Amycolatopsis circi]|uniref:hypothetical protein n=1 Tax=Amycolatopsis circi TaxID=871959 RepID=UPI0013BEA277|nr:hypothetical protein [Amycolatopsis circi]